jgi:hypothetical protein
MIVTNLKLPSRSVDRFYNKCGTEGSKPKAKHRCAGGARSTTLDMAGIARMEIPLEIRKKRKNKRLNS